MKSALVTFLLRHVLPAVWERLVAGEPFEKVAVESAEAQLLARQIQERANAERARRAIRAAKQGG